MRKLFLTIIFALLSNAYAQEPFDIEKVVVDEVEVNGISIFSQKDLEKVIELSPGDRYEKSKIVKSAKNLQELYRLHGYENMKLQSRLTQRSTTSGKEYVLELSISEGLPTRVAQVILQVSNEEWNERLKNYSDRLGFKTGDVFNQEKLMNGYRSLQDSMGVFNFMGVKVHEAQIEEVTPGGLGVDVALLTSTARWVNLRVKMDLGERISFGFQGNTVFATTDLNLIVDEIRLLGFSQDYLERVKTRVLEEYYHLGYDQAKIEVFTFENNQKKLRHVSLKITEGPRVEIGEILFDGNNIFSAKELKDQLYATAPPTFVRGYYFSKDVDKASDLLIEWMKSKGYLAAKMISVSRNYNVKKTKMNLTFYLYEGEQTIVDHIVFQNLKVFTDEEVKKMLQIETSKPLNLFTFNDGLEFLKLSYRAKGYYDFKILNEGTSQVVSYFQENRSASILLDLSEGIQYRTGKIEITGLRKTKPDVVKRELLITEGEVLEEPLWIQSEVRLRRLGLFSNVAVRAFQDPNLKNVKNIKIELQEGSPGLIAGGVGVRNDLGARVFSQIAYSNLWGKNHTASLTGTVNRRFKQFGDNFCASSPQELANTSKDHCFIEFDMQLAYMWPWALLGRTTFRPQATFERRQFRNFDADTLSLSLSLERQLLSRPNLTAVLNYSLERIEQYNAAFAVDNNLFLVGSITPTLTLDMRDNPLTPTKGFFSTMSYELARPEFLSQKDPIPIAYSRFQIRNDFFFPLPKDIGLYFSFRTGIEFNFSKAPENDRNNPNYSIPIYKQFVLGGMGSLRGFREQGLFIDPDLAVTGYASYVNYRFQLDLPFSGNMRFGPFVDAANIQLDDYSLGKLRYGMGVGLRYRSPVGPVNFDLGINPNPKPEAPATNTRPAIPAEDSYQLHFSIGVI